MEVDMQSPSTAFRPMPFAVKRPRSPGSPTQERQTKRISLAPLGTEGHGFRRASTASDGVAGGAVGSQDDWVRQARELSIASPLSVTAGFSPGMGGGAAVARSGVDEHMAVDDEESQSQRGHGHPGSSSARPWATRSHLPLIHITTTTPAPSSASVTNANAIRAPSPVPFSVLTEPSASSSDSASSTPSISAPATQTSAGAGAPRPCPPDIFLFPPTPSDTPSHQEQFTPGGESGSASQARTLDREEGSPRPTASAGRRHRVTMGPRADCAKCRAGVRGHWMHFD